MIKEKCPKCSEDIDTIINEQCEECNEKIPPLESSKENIEDEITLDDDSMKNCSITERFETVNENEEEVVTEKPMSPIAKSKLWGGFKNKKVLASCLMLLLILIMVPATYSLSANYRAYNNALQMLHDGEFMQAKEIFAELEDYRDSENMVLECYYQYAIYLDASRKYERAIELFKELADYGDAMDRLESSSYNYAIYLSNKGDFLQSIELLEQLGDYKDSKKLLAMNYYNLGDEALQEGEYTLAMDYFVTAKELRSDWGEDNPHPTERINETFFLMGESLFERGDFLAASTAFENAGNHPEATEMHILSLYEHGIQLGARGEYEEAITYLSQINYEDSEYLVDLFTRRVNGERFINGRFYYTGNEFERILNYNIQSRDERFSLPMRLGNEGSYVGELLFLDNRVEGFGIRVLLMNPSVDRRSYENIAFFMEDEMSIGRDIEISIALWIIQMSNTNLSIAEAREILSNTIALGGHEQIFQGIVYNSFYSPLDDQLILEIYAEGGTPVIRRDRIE